MMRHLLLPPPVLTRRYLASRLAAWMTGLTIAEGGNPPAVAQPITKNTTAIAVTDIVYFSEGDTRLSGAFYCPAGQGPFPMVVSVHGGVWVSGDRQMNGPVARYLADGGIAVFAIDFRMPPVAAYPASLVDVNFAVRWVKANAARFSTTPDRVGLIGDSSGGHLAVLTALCPDRPLYASRPLDLHPTIDAHVDYVVSCWGVLDPLARYKIALARQNTVLIEGHKAYWGDEAHMAEGGPQGLIDRGDAIRKPAILAIYGTADQNIDYRIPEHFIESYRKAGGTIESQAYPGKPHAFIQPPFDAASIDALNRICAFIKTNAKRA